MELPEQSGEYLPSPVKRGRGRGRGLLSTSIQPALRQEFCHGHAGAGDLLGEGEADVADVPGLVDVAGDLLLALRVADHEAEAGRVGRQPLALRRIAEGRLQ